MNETKTFFNMVTAALVKDVRDGSLKMWLIGGGLFAAGVVGALSSKPWEDMFLGAMFPIALGLLFIGLQIKGTLQAGQIAKGDKELRFMETLGVDGPKHETVRKLNQAYADGKLLFEINEAKGANRKEGLRLFLFPDHIVYVRGTSLYVIAAEKLYWVYVSVREEKNRIMGYNINFLTDEKHRELWLYKEQEADNIVRQLAQHYSLYTGYDSELKKLYNKNKPEFMRKMEDFKKSQKAPASSY